MDIGMRVRLLRESRNISQYRLAKSAGVAASAINKLESGNMSPSLEFLEKVCAGLGIHISDFFSEAPQNTPVHLSQIVDVAKRLTSDQQALIIQVMLEMSCESKKDKG